MDFIMGEVQGHLLKFMFHLLSCFICYVVKYGERLENMARFYCSVVLCKKYTSYRSLCVIDHNVDFSQSSLCLFYNIVDKDFIVCTNL